MATTFKHSRPEYELTVRSAVIAFIASFIDNVPTYESEGANSLVDMMDIIKTLGISPDASSSKVYASGLVYDVVAGVKGATVSLGAVALPRTFVDKAIGAKVIGALSIDKTMAAGKEFSFGYYCEMSDGSKVYYWHPRCKLVIGDEDHNTSDDGDIDPEVSYDIEILPTHEGVWRVRYYTNAVAVDKVPLTLEQFYGALAYTVAQIEALPALEAAVPAG